MKKSWLMSDDDELLVEKSSNKSVEEIDDFGCVCIV